MRLQAPPRLASRDRQGVASAARKGYVLFAVLLVTVVLSLTAYRFTDSMVMENTVAVRSTEQVQARLSAMSGIAHAAGILADPNILSGQLAFDVSDNAELFSGRTVGDAGRGRFSLINLSEALDGTGTGETRYPLRYGIVDEGGKININGLILKDPTGTVLFAALMTLPGMTQQIADSIVDWVDADSTARPEGAENDYYAGMQTPYLCKNGPLNSVDELLLVQGVTPTLLYGNDRNRNGKLEAAEDDGTAFGRGWSEYLTCYGREINVDSAGLPRLNLNGPDIKTLSEKLTALVGQDVSDYIVYYRIKGGTAVTPVLNPLTQVAAPVSQLRDLVQKAVDAGTKPSRRVASVITIMNTQIALDRPPATVTTGPGNRMTVVMPPQPIVASPINDAASLEKFLTILLDKCTTEDGFEIAPRINVNSAPLSVLAALPGMTETDVNTIVSSRGGQSLTDPAVNTGAWLMTVAKMPPDKFKALEPYISGRSWTYRVHSVGYSAAAGGRRGAVARVEAVIDVGTRTADTPPAGLPRIVYFRDLTDLGRGFADLPGSQ